MMKLRPHHALCLLVFDPHNHSEPYIEIMYSVIDKLNSKPEQKIMLSSGLDIICNYCPHNDKNTKNGGICKKEEKVRAITQNILALVGVNIGETITWETLRSKMVDNIIANGRFGEACGGCSYFEQCKAVSLKPSGLSPAADAK